MPTESAFRLSTYLTLATACACLGYAEAPFLPEVGFFAAAAVVALAVIYRLETRVQLLSLPDANKLGAGLALAWAGWTAYRILREAKLNELHAMGWQLLLVLLFGPLLMALMPAKLARREKHAGDYWGLQAAGLAVVGLSGAMAEDAPCFVLMAVYAACGVWSLTLFFLARSTGAVPPVPHREPAADGPARAVDPGPARRSAGRELGRGLLWLAVTAAIAVPLYLLTPRSTAGKLEFGKQRIEIGYAADQMIDLNRTGKLQTNPEPAFEVEATTDDGRPLDTLSPSQRWRGITLVDYEKGSWRPDLNSPLTVVAPGERAATPGLAVWSPPDLGPDRYRLTFTFPYQLARVGPPVLADPVVWVPGRQPPVATLEPSGARAWLPTSDGTFLRQAFVERRGPPGGRSIRYVQVTRPLPDPDLGTGFALDEDADEAAVRRLTATPPDVRRVKQYADELLVRLIREGRLPADVRDPVRWRPKREAHEAVARAFADHLAHRAGLSYSVNLRRVDKDVDPVVDFLENSKVGHCERFAAALVLMLRSEGIPAALVLGFRGCDPRGEGRYVVRQEDAHSWVQALVSRPPARPGGGPTWHWLSLDPSPSGSADDVAASGWLGAALNEGQSIFDDYFVNYNPEQRRRAVAAVGRAVTRPDVLAGLGIGAVVVGAVRRLRRRSRAALRPPDGPARWFDQLLAVLAAHGFVPEPGQTPREFADAVAAALRERPAAAAVADVPVGWAEAYYAARFGGAPTPPEREAALEERLADLRRALEGG